MPESEHPQAIDAEFIGRVSYDDALTLQEHTVAAIRSGQSGPRLLLLEHDPVFTIGRTRDQSSLRAVEALPHPLREINRGGQATYHGPGQLVGYPILDLHPYGRDLHRYLRFLEQVVIDVLATYQISAGRSAGQTGVWVGDRKIASIGVGVRHWITMHGFALNVSGELTGFGSITPCGISGVTMTSIEREITTAPSVETVADVTARTFAAGLSQLANEPRPASQAKIDS
ncbi:MAG: lipoyl(octanoyl) transferase LipB [Chthoniobacterales bacterium]